jgi:3-hydroxyacyl-[acyl-carrier-protein] dehydratase
MRWIWIDKFTDFQSRKRAVAVKNVSMAEEHLHDLHPAFPIVPHTLIGEARNFEEKVILAKIGKALFHRLTRPGDTLVFDATIDKLDESGAATRGTVRIAGDDSPAGLVAEIELMFSHIDKNMAGLRFPEHNFVFTEQFTDLMKSYRHNSAIPI